MPPYPFTTNPLVARDSIASGARDSANTIQAQWRAPSNILSILLLVAGDIVGEALDQLSGQTLSPVVYSFGWISYAVSAFSSAVGIHQLITQPKKAKSGSKVINIDSGKSNDNHSWVLNRVLRDWDYWKPQEAQQDEDAQQREKWGRELGNGSEYGDTEDDDGDEMAQPLRILLFLPSSSHPQARPSKDRLWYSGIAVAILQLGIAAIPCGLHGRWAPLMIVFVGTILAFTTGALPQFGKEKWDCKRRSRKTIALTRPGGQASNATDILVIRGDGKGLDLEDMAKGGAWHSQTLRKRAGSKGRNKQVTAWPWTRLATGTLAACWIVLLITVGGVRGDSWYLMGSGVLGLVQNAYVAGAPRRPEAQGLHMEFVGFVRGANVQDTLKLCEERWPGIGNKLAKAVFGGMSLETTGEGSLTNNDG